MKLEIIDMIDDGRCVAKYEGKTVFVDGGSVGEIIEAKKIKEKEFDICNKNKNNTTITL